MMGFTLESSKLKQHEVNIFNNNAFDECCELQIDTHRTYHLYINDKSNELAEVILYDDKVSKISYYSPNTCMNYSDNKWDKLPELEVNRNMSDGVNIAYTSFRMILTKIIVMGRFDYLRKIISMFNKDSQGYQDIHSLVKFIMSRVYSNIIINE